MVLLLKKYYGFGFFVVTDVSSARLHVLKTLQAL